MKSSQIHLINIIVSQKSVQHMKSTNDVKTD